MANDDQAMLKLLKDELAFLDRDDFGHSVSAPLPESAFHESQTCIDSNEAAGTGPCVACHLIDFVAHDHHSEVLPCRFIALNEAGETIEHLEAQGNQAKLDATLKEWLKAKIKEIEGRESKPDVQRRVWSTDFSRDLPKRMKPD